MSEQPTDNVSRLDALEMMVTHQDRLIAELNEAITSHWRRIEVLERQVTQLREELHNIQPARDGPEPPPPHY